MEYIKLNNGMDMPVLGFGTDHAAFPDPAGHCRHPEKQQPGACGNVADVVI